MTRASAHATMHRRTARSLDRKRSFGEYCLLPYFSQSPLNYSYAHGPPIPSLNRLSRGLTLLWPSEVEMLASPRSRRLGRLLG